MAIKTGIPNIFPHAQKFEQGFQEEKAPTEEIIQTGKRAEAMSIPGTAFVHAEETTLIYSHDEGSVAIPAGGDGGVSVRMVAPIILPHQATITSALVIGTFAGAETWELFKFQVTGTPTAFPAIASGSMNTKAENMSIVVDNENFSYFLSTSLLTIDNDVLMAALLEYTT